MHNPLIHPTAIIDPSAELAEGVEVGPYAIIGQHVKLGPGCRVGHHASLEGPLIAGESNHFFPKSAIGFVTQDLKYHGEPTHLEIGSHNVFREFCTVHRATAVGDKTIIGNKNLFLAYAHIAHNCVVGNNTIFSNNATLAGHVTVGDWAIVSGFAAVHQFCRIGAHSIIGGCTKIVQDVPPYFVADGNPAQLRGINVEGLKRRGFSEAQSKALRRAYRTIADKTTNMSQALEILEADGELSLEIAQVIEFIRSTKRGIVSTQPPAV